MDGILCVIVLAYAAWAYYSGWKWIDGRYAFLEKEGVQYTIIKAIIGFCVGTLIGWLLLFAFVWKLLFH